MSEEHKKHEDALPKLVVDEINKQIESGDWAEDLTLEVASAIAMVLADLARTEEVRVCIAKKLLDSLDLSE